MFGSQVRGHRGRLGLTQEELADRTGVGLRTIRDLETGRVRQPRPATARLLADAFGLAGGAREAFLAGTDAVPVTEPAPHPTPAQPTPAQLPADVAGFAGRAGYLRRLDELLDRAAGQPTAAVLVAVSGTAGVGKTALAVHWAHRVADRFPDGQLYVNLRGYAPGQAPVDPAEAVGGMLSALGVPPEQVPAGLDARAALYRTLLAGRRVLVLLDNARDADQVRPLLPGSAGCLALLTSRDLLAGLAVAAGAHLVPLDLMSTVEARALLAGRLGAGRLAAEPGAVAGIVAGCAGLPLALAVVAARVASRPTFPLAAVAAELTASRDRLAAFAGPDPASDVRAVFSWSYRTLSPAAARLYRLLGVHPGPDISAAAAISLAGEQPPVVRSALAELGRAQLVDEPAPGRFGCHDLLRAYAAELADAHEPAADRAAALGRVLDHYLHTGSAAVRLIQPHRDPISLLPPPAGVCPEPLVDQDAALRWYSAELPVLLAAVDRAAAAGLDRQCWQLGWTVAIFLDRRGRWAEKAAVGRTGLAAAERLADPAAQAYVHRDLGRTYTFMNQYGDAHAHYQQALGRYRQLGDDVGRAHIHLSLGWLLELQDRVGEAIGHAQHALDLYRAAGRQYGVANALNNIGWLHALRGDHAEALACSQQALVLLQQLGNTPGEAAAWDSVGHAHHRLAQYDRAVACYTEAVDRYRSVADRYHEADTLTHLAETQHATGDPAAERTWRHALEILVELDHPDAEQVRARLAFATAGSTPQPAVR